MHLRPVPVALQDLGSIEKCLNSVNTIEFLYLHFATFSIFVVSITLYFNSASFVVGALYSSFLLIFG